MKKIALLGCFALGCQSYDFEKIQPLAIAQTTEKHVYEVQGSAEKAPNMMLLIDRSCSMMESSCTIGCGSKISEMKTSMATFLDQSGSGIRFGVSAFPSSMGQCNATSAYELDVIQSDDPNALTTNAAVARSKVETMNPNGQTPTAPSLRFLKNNPNLLATDRKNYVLLLTDGIPNCVSPCSGGGASCPSTDEDKNAAVAAVEELAQLNISTIVIGFGAGTSGGGAATLTRMATAGNYRAPCPKSTDAECGGTVGSCNVATKLCNTRYYQANNAQELAKALASISAAVTVSAECAYALSSQPSDPRLLSVIINGENVPQGSATWTYGAGRVTFADAYCSKLQGSTQSLSVEFRIVEQL